jgi:hypothetical protein
METDPVRDKPRIQAIFDEVYQQMFHAGQKGKDIVACAEFLMDRSFGRAVAEDLDQTSGIRVVVLNIDNSTNTNRPSAPVSPDFAQCGLCGSTLGCDCGA